MMGSQGTASLSQFLCSLGGFEQQSSYHNCWRGIACCFFCDVPSPEILVLPWLLINWHTTETQSVVFLREFWGSTLDPLESLWEFTLKLMIFPHDEKVKTHKITKGVWYLKKKKNNLAQTYLVQIESPVLILPKEKKCFCSETTILDMDLL